MDLDFRDNFNDEQEERKDRQYHPMQNLDELDFDHDIQRQEGSTLLNLDRHQLQP